MHKGNSKSYINFLIRLSRLTKLYPKFARTSLGLGILNVRMRYFVARIEDDKDFWLSG